MAGLQRPDDGRSHPRDRATDQRLRRGRVRALHREHVLRAARTLHRRLRSGLRRVARARSAGAGPVLERIAWSPELLLLAAVEACFLLTFRAIAQASKIELTSLAVEAEGTVDRRDGRMRFTEIVLRPRVMLPAGENPVRVRRALESSSASTASRSGPAPRT
jgi:uncharacterized OsmC-like protein